jgi:alpha-ketoglutaric semialdehyde dehydrogenase
MNEHKLFLNGEWVESAAGETFEDTNPATLEPIGVFQKASLEDVRSAVDSSEEAFYSWSRTPAPQRGKILFRAARLLEERKEELARLRTERSSRKQEEMFKRP